MPSINPLGQNYNLQGSQFSPRSLPEKESQAAKIFAAANDFQTAAREYSCGQITHTAFESSYTHLMTAMGSDTKISLYDSAQNLKRYAEQLLQSPTSYNESNYAAANRTFTDDAKALEGSLKN